MKTKVTIVGGGNMGEAILSGICQKYLVAICEQDKKRASFLRKRYNVFTADLEKTVEDCSFVILAVKPQVMENVLKELKEILTPKHLVISIAAGVTTKYLEKWLGKDIRVVRTMPNLPVKVGAGMTAVCKGKNVTAKNLKDVKDIFDCIGQTIVVEEKLIDAVTAVSGSGPAYVFTFVENFTKAAKNLGLKESLAKELVTQTLKGSLLMLEDSKDDASILRSRVTSKGGTTAAALKIFQKNKTDQAFKNALSAAKRRSKELSQ